MRVLAAAAVAAGAELRASEPGAGVRRPRTNGNLRGCTVIFRAGMSGERKTTFHMPQQLPLIAIITVIITVSAISYADVVDMGMVADVLFERLLDAAHAAHISLSLTAADRITDYVGAVLSGSRGIATFKSDGGGTYAVVAASDDHGVQILDITDPHAVTIADSITDTDSLMLNAAIAIDIFKSGDRTYAAVAAELDHGVQILDITDPYYIVAAGSISDNGDRVLRLASGITTFESGTNIYAAVTSWGESGVQILNVTNPYNITAAGSITDTPDLKLFTAFGITTFESGTDTYVAVTGSNESGVQILNVTNPYNITAAGSITDDDDLAILYSTGITTFESGTNIYVAVAGADDSGVQILNVTNPYNITAAGSIVDNIDLELDSPLGIAVFGSGNRTYAAVASEDDDDFTDDTDGVQIIDITNPYNITAAGSITDTGSLVLNNAFAVATFESGGGNTYAAVTSSK